MKRRGFLGMLAGAAAAPKASGVVRKQFGPTLVFGNPDPAAVKAWDEISRRQDAVFDAGRDIGRKGNPLRGASISSATPVCIPSEVWEDYSR